MIWMPLYFDEVNALAACLSTLQLGALIRLRTYAWHQDPPCTLPDDDTRLAAISGLGASWGECGVAMRELLTAENGRLLDRALLERYERQHALHAKRSFAGQVGGLASSSKRQANGQQPQPIATILPDIPLSFSSTVLKAESVESAEQTASKPPAKPWRELLAENGVQLPPSGAAPQPSPADPT